MNPDSSLFLGGYTKTGRKLGASRALQVSSLNVICLRFTLLSEKCNPMLSFVGMVYKAIAHDFPVLSATTTCYYDEC